MMKPRFSQRLIFFLADSAEMPSESDSSERVHLAAEWVGVVKGGWVGQSGDEEVKRAPSCDVGWLCGLKRELASERVPTQ